MRFPVAIEWLVQGASMALCAEGMPALKIAPVPGVESWYIAFTHGITNKGEVMEYEGKLIPILREGIDVIKMILFKKLKDRLSHEYTGREPLYINRMAGAIINRLFGTPNAQEPYATFVQENESAIEREFNQLAIRFPEMRIPLTDALRVQFLCDSQDGIDSSDILAQARQLDILLLDREIPLPAKFISLARQLGASLDILNKQEMVHH